jgi:hypothetical protein
MCISGSKAYVKAVVDPRELGADIWALHLPVMERRRNAYRI